MIQFLQGKKINIYPLTESNNRDEKSGDQGKKMKAKKVEKFSNWRVGKICQVAADL